MSTPGTAGNWKADPRWGMSCLAYNVHAELAPACRAELVRVQTELAGLGPGLLQCPPDAIHVSLAFLLAVVVFGFVAVGPAELAAPVTHPSGLAEQPVALRRRAAKLAMSLAVE